MNGIAQVLHSISVRLERVRTALRSRYWAALIAARGGKAGKNLVVQRNARLDLPRGARAFFEDGVTLGEGARIYVGAKGIIRIGNGAYVGRGTTIAANREVAIGPGTQIAHLCTIIDTDHRFDSAELPLSQQGEVTEAILIGANVWIGAGAVILKGRRIADRAVIGAAAVVTKDVSSGEVVAGNPARVIRSGSGPR